MTGRVCIIDLDHMTVYEEFEKFQLNDQAQTPPSWLEAYLKGPDHMAKNFASIVTERPPAETVFRSGCPPTLPGNSVPTYFANYLRNYLERDAPYAHPSAAHPSFVRYLRAMAALTTHAIDSALLSRELDISPETINEWHHVLRQTHQWRDILPLYASPSKGTAKKPKGVFTNTGLACYLTNVHSPILLTQHFQTMFETYCINQIYALLDSCQWQPFISHWRTLKGAGVGIVLEMNNKLYPIEIKATDAPTKHDARGILAFRETYKERVQHGLILHAGTHCYAVHEHVTALPFNALMKKA